MGTEINLNVWQGHDPLPDQYAFITDPHKFRLFSSGFGSGKSSTGCRMSIAQSLGYPGSRDLVGRFERSTLRETTLVTYMSCLDQIGLKDGTHYSYKSQANRIDWYNGSTTLFMFLNDPTGATYGSLELNTGFVDEGSEVDDAVYTVLFGARLRWHLPDCKLSERLSEWMRAHPGQTPPREMTCKCMETWRGWVATNPGRSRYLRNIVTNGDPLWGVTHAAVKGNPYNTADYYETMEGMARLQGGNWRERFVLGSWDHFEGQRFDTLDRSYHVLEPDFDLHTGDWEHVEGIDFGWENPTHWVLLAKPTYATAPLIVVDCLEEHQIEPHEMARKIKEKRVMHGVDTEVQLYGDPAGNQASQATGRSIIDLYREHGIYVTPASWAKRPSPRADDISSRINATVVYADRQMPRLSWMPAAMRNFESCLHLHYKGNENETFAKDDDHGFDALGYAVSGVWDTPDPEVEKQERFREIYEQYRIKQPWERDDLEPDTY